MGEVGLGIFFQNLQNHYFLKKIRKLKSFESHAAVIENRLNPI